VEASDTGIILRLRPSSETSLLVHWLTRGSGRILTLAKGARSQKSSFRGKLDLFFEASFSFQQTRESGPRYLKELNLLDTRPALRSDLDKLSLAAYAAHLLERNTETDTPVNDLFLLFADFLRVTCSTPPNAWMLLLLELKFLQVWGSSLTPEPRTTSPGACAILVFALKHEFASSFHLSPSQSQILELAGLIQRQAQATQINLPPRRLNLLYRLKAASPS